jgi:hypothetical protein
MTLQSRDGDEVTDTHSSSHHHQHHQDEEEEMGAKDSTKSSVFSSLYLKAAQVFPLSRGASSRVGDHLPPHPEVSYHSIVSRQESKENGAVVSGII